MSGVPIRPEAREDAAEAIVLLISDEASAERIADAAIKAFLAAEEITIERADGLTMRLCGLWRRADG